MPTDPLPTDDDAMDRLRAALGRIETAAADNVERSLEIQRRVQALRRQIDAGASIAGVVEDEPAPRIVELITMNMTMLESVGAEVRAALALALRSEGLTIEAIAELFGVTRQRISALLRQKAATTVVEG